MPIFLSGDEGLAGVNIIVSPVFVDPAQDGSILRQITMIETEFFSLPPDTEKDEIPKPRVMIIPVPSYCGDERPSYEDISVLTPWENPDEARSSLYHSVCTAVTTGFSATATCLHHFVQLVNRLPSGGHMTERPYIPPYVVPGDVDDHLGQEGFYTIDIVGSLGELRELLTKVAKDNDLGPIDAIDKFISGRYSSLYDTGAGGTLGEEEEGEFGLTEAEQSSLNRALAGELRWKFLLCTLPPNVTDPSPIIYTHALHRLETMDGKHDLRLQNLFVPTICYHPSKLSEGLDKAPFDHQILVLYGESFAGAGVGISDSIQQSCLEAHTFRPVPPEFSAKKPSMSDQGEYDQSLGEDGGQLSCSMQSNFGYADLQSQLQHRTEEEVRWPFLQSPFDYMFQIKEQDILAYGLDSVTAPNKDIYVKLQSALASLSIPKAQ